MTRIRGLAAFLVTVAFVVSVPWLLVRFGSWAFTGLPSIGGARDLADTVVSDTMVFGVLTLAAWVVWAVFTMSLVVEVVAAARGAQAPRIAFAGLLQRTARGLVAAIVLATSLSHGQPAAFAGPPQRLPQLPARGSTQVVDVPQALRLPENLDPPAAAPTADNDQATAGTQRTISVARGDSAWGLAEEHLGDGLRWRELWELNRGRPQRDGRAWTDPQIIRTGWQLALPDGDNTAAPEPIVDAVATPTTYIVVDGDTLSGIAEEHLGDANRYFEIFELNRDRVQPDGRHLTDPNLIVTGWQLVLPNVSGVEEPTVAAPPVEALPADTASVESSIPEPAAQEPAPSTTSAPTNSTSVTPRIATEPVTQDVPQSPSASVPEGTEQTRAVADFAGNDGESWWATTAPVLAGVSGATVLATGLLLRLRRSQRRRTLHGAGASTKVSVAEHAVVAAADVPLVRWAGQALASVVTRLDVGNATKSAPVAVELSPEAGIEVLWDAPNPDAPAPWIAADEGWAWRLPYDPDADVPVDALPAALPALATIGTREGRQLMLDLEAFGTVTVAGDVQRVDDFLRSVAVELSTGDDLADSYVLSIGVEGVATTERLMAVDVETAIARANAICNSVGAALDNAGTPTTFAYRSGQDGGHLEATVVVIAADAEDPADVLTVRPRLGIAVIGAGEWPDAGARIEIASDGTARLEPLGVSFVAVGVPSESGTLISELASEASVDDGYDGTANGHYDPSANGHRAARINGHSAQALRTGPVAMACPEGEPLTLFELPDVEDEDEGTGSEPSPRSPLDALLVVKVLGTPRVPDRPNLKRRELILTVFLACRGGQVNASAVLDAIWGGRAVQGKTVWNLVGQTRSALGLLPDGTDVLPPSDRTLRMKGLSAGVTTDLAILRFLYEQAQTVSSSEAIGWLRQALSLVEGPPFDADGYDWAHHGTQDVSDASRLIEQATEQLVNLALDIDDVDLAREAVAQGLRGLPGDEVLYRLRMRVEHHAGNLTGVSGAFDELMHHLADFDTDPSPSTLDLRRELLGSKNS